MKRMTLVFLYAFCVTTGAEANDLESKLFKIPNPLPVQVSRAHRHSLTLKTIRPSTLLKEKVTLTREQSAAELYKLWADAWVEPIGELSKGKPIAYTNWGDWQVRHAVTDFLLLADSGLSNDARADVLKQKAQWKFDEAPSRENPPKDPNEEPTSPAPGSVAQFQNWMKMLDKMPSFIKNHSKWYGALKVSQEIMFTDVPTSYDGGAVTDLPVGIINYQSKKLMADESLRLMAQFFYTKLTRAQALAPGQRILIWEKTSRDIWALALEASHGDRLSAMRILSVFGHDNGYNQLTMKYIDASTTLSPAEKMRLRNDFQFLNYRNINGGRYFADLYKPEGLRWKNGKPVNISPWLMRRFLKESKRAVALGLGENPQRLVEADYYHFYAGAMMTAEMAAKGVAKSGAMALPVFLSEMQGYAYKKLANQQYIRGDAKLLFNLGCVKYHQKRCKRPKNWSSDEASDLRFQRAKVLLDLNLLHVELNAEQHRLGALWAFEKLAH